MYTSSKLNFYKILHNNKHLKLILPFKLKMLSKVKKQKTILLSSKSKSLVIPMSHAWT